MREGDVVLVKGPHPYTVADGRGTAPEVVVHVDDRLTDLTGADVTEAWRAGTRVSGRRPDGSAIIASGNYRVADDVTGRLLRAARCSASAIRRRSRARHATASRGGGRRRPCAANRARPAARHRPGGEAAGLVLAAPRQGARLVPRAERPTASRAPRCA